MPSEYRRILFSNIELIEAFHEYSLAGPVKLPQGVIISCTPVAEDKVAVRLELVDKANDETHIASLSPEIVAAALLHYCFKHRIPMPRDSVKSIEKHGDEISLNVRIEGRAKKLKPDASAGTAKSPPEG